ncbi:hypothetical protein EDD22DRAFT_850118 [Suillus occidentalis]|nr:hypothetical protein EDD22DRAFT_850118 [Suillus occidentalis]
MSKPSPTSENEMVNFADFLSGLSSSCNYQHLYPPMREARESARARRLSAGIRRYSISGDVMVRKMKREKRWTKTRVKHMKERYMVILAKMMVEVGEADEADDDVGSDGGE